MKLRLNSIRYKILVAFFVTLIPLLAVSSFVVGRQEDIAIRVKEGMLADNQKLGLLWEAQTICDLLINIVTKEKVSSTDIVRFKEKLYRIEKALDQVGYNSSVYPLLIQNISEIKRTKLDVHKSFRPIVKKLTQLENMIDIAIDEAIKQSSGHTEWFVSNFDQFLQLQKVEFLIAILMVVLASFYMSSYLVKPIKFLQRALENMAEGELGQQIEVNFTDELGQVQRAFNHMSKKLHDSVVSKNYVSKILNNMAEPIAVVKMDGTIEATNNALCKLIEVDAESIKGRYLENFVALPKLQIIDFSRAAMIEDNCLLTTNTKKVVPVRILLTLVKQSGHEDCIIVSLHDQRNEIKTRLKQQKYVDQIKQHEKLVALGTLSAEVAHRLNQPLTALTLTLEQMKRQTLSTESDYLQPSIAVCKKEVERIALAVKNILSYTRRAHIEETQVSINAVIEATTKVLDDKARSANIEFQTEILESDLSIPGHKDELSELFYVLFQNAIDAAPKDRKSSCRVSSEVKSDVLIITVKDTCLGIPENQLEHIFEPFFSSKPMGQGTGLGLSIARKIVADHDGSIEVSSVVNEGTTFTIRLPL